MLLTVSQKSEVKQKHWKLLLYSTLPISDLKHFWLVKKIYICAIMYQKMQKAGYRCIFMVNIEDVCKLIQLFSISSNNELLYRNYRQENSWKRNLHFLDFLLYINSKLQTIRCLISSVNRSVVRYFLFIYFIYFIFFT